MTRFLSESLFVNDFCRDYVFGFCWLHLEPNADHKILRISIKIGSHYIIITIATYLKTILSHPFTLTLSMNLGNLKAACKAVAAVVHNISLSLNNDLSLVLILWLQTKCNIELDPKYIYSGNSFSALKTMKKNYVNLPSKQLLTFHSSCIADYKWQNMISAAGITHFISSGHASSVLKLCCNSPLLSWILRTSPL